MEIGHIIVPAIFGLAIGFFVGFTLVKNKFDYKGVDISLDTERDRKVALDGINKGYSVGSTDGVEARKYIKRVTTEFRSAVERNMEMNDDTLKYICDKAKGVTNKPKLTIVEPENNDFRY